MIPRSGCNFVIVFLYPLEALENVDTLFTLFAYFCVSPNKVVFLSFTFSKYIPNQYLNTILSGNNIQCFVY